MKFPAKEPGKLLVKKVELSDEEKNALSDKLLQVKKDMKVVVRYFVKAAEVPAST